MMYHKTDPAEDEIEFEFMLPKSFLKIQSFNFVSCQSSETVAKSWLFYSNIIHSFSIQHLQIKT